MSPIKHVWDALDRCVQQPVPVPANIKQLRAAIEEQQLKRSGTTFHVPTKNIYICDQQMHIYIPNHVKSID
jgi:hypothetical protein